MFQACHKAEVDLLKLRSKLCTALAQPKGMSSFDSDVPMWQVRWKLSFSLLERSG